MADVLFTNVRILDGTGQLPYSGSVLVQGNRIRQVGRSSAPLAAGNAMVIDGAGATLMPGMCEAHTHFSWNDAATLSAIQTMPLEEHVLWCRGNRQALPRGRLHLLRGRGLRQAPPRRRDQERHRIRPDPRAALPRGEPGDHRARRPRRRDAAAPALPRIQLRRERVRGRRDAEGGAPVPQVRRRFDQAQSLGRQLHAAVALRDHVDDGRRGCRGDARGEDPRQARHRSCTQLRQREAGAAPRHRPHLPRELRRRRGARHARGRQGPRLRRARRGHPLRHALRGRGLRRHPRDGGGHGLRDRVGSGPGLARQDAQARHPRAAPAATTASR